MQISPPKHLAPFIRHYIFLENPEKAGKNLRLFTDGSTGLILSGGMDLYSSTSDGRIPSAFFTEHYIHIKIFVRKVVSR
ncbi:DUF6597 domain-containing transcriptional factor [Chryseobacterium arthrosphaerae]|uniref:DUF6597 domain-containing protein n=1 Tax=Chryseobacterium arthrosphaerae TaxID=651561 RepID=A0A1B8ZQI3_9FLAO|nr:DUF6597 domain-containing transcriptional factor [Chryseobacterium arthrosphaerae]OCA73845.1 hypothetical protein BBI00_05575 [Chryseobacterium arthrosphaerae]